jgi:protein O-GlcNAc transferase
LLAREPDHPDALHLLGLVVYRAGRLDEARALINRALARDPGNAVFHANLGNVEKDAGDAQAAAASYRRALAADPRMSAPRNNLGTLLLAQGDLDAAIDCFRAVVEEAPQHARAWHNLGNALARRGDVAGAASAYRRAVAAQPDYADAWSDLGLALGLLGDHAGAAQTLATRLRLSPTPAAHADLALALHRAGDLIMARAHYERALAADPAALEVRCNLCALLQKCCDWAALATHWPAVRAAIEQGRAGVPGGLLIGQPGASAALQLAAARANVAAQPVLARSAPCRPVEPGRRLRVGYLSADFREHATAYLATELFELHERERYEVVLLSYGPDDGSDARRRLARAADRFVDLRECNDDEAAQAIARLAVDVLIDLNGNTDNGRMGIAARRPAPVQASWLGFPGTLGAPFYDWLIADWHLVPPGEERWYAERVIRLPDCYQSNDRQRPRPPATAHGEPTAFPADAVVLCCFNQAFKITADVFACWLRILRRHPRSILWLLDDNAVATAALADQARRQGIDPARLVFAPHRPLAEHLGRYRMADLAVDTFPCSSHTTASDALWMTCPLVTLTGATFAGRVATSLLRNVGLDELAAPDLDAYEASLDRLIEHPEERAKLRALLEAAPGHAPLFDTPRFARHFERAIDAMVAAAVGDAHAPRCPTG